MGSGSYMIYCRLCLVRTCISVLGRGERMANIGKAGGLSCRGSVTLVMGARRDPSGGGCRMACCKISTKMGLPKALSKTLQADGGL